MKYLLFQSHNNHMEFLLTCSVFLGGLCTKYIEDRPANPTLSQFHLLDQTENSRLIPWVCRYPFHRFNSGFKPLEFCQENKYKFLKLHLAQLTQITPPNIFMDLPGTCSGQFYKLQTERQSLPARTVRSCYPIIFSIYLIAIEPKKLPPK